MSNDAVNSKENRDLGNELLSALARNKAAEARLLLQAGANPNYQTSPNGELLLNLMVVNGKIDMVQLLLKEGADPDARCNRGQTSLIAAARANNMAMAQLLLKEGADPDERCSKGGTSLMAAAANKNMAMVQMLLVHRAEVNLANWEVKTPLMYAAGVGNAPIVRLLLGAKADPGLTDSTGKTARDLALKCKDQPIADMLERSVSSVTETVLSGGASGDSAPGPQGASSGGPSTS